MLSKLKCVSVALVGMLWAGTAAANSKLDLDTLMQASLDFHPSIKIKQSDLDATEFQKSAADWARFPTFGVNTKTLNDGTSITATLEQPLWAGGMISGQIEKANNNQLIALYDLAGTKLQVLIEVNENYFNLKQQQLRLDAAQKNVKEHTLLLEIIQRRVKSEVSPKSDDLLARSRLRSASSELLKIKRELSKVRNKLIHLTNLSVNELELPNEVNLDTYTLEQLIDLAILNSPMLKKLYSESDLARSETKVVKAETMPKIVLGYQDSFGVDDFSTGRTGLYLGVQVQTGAGLSSLDTIKASAAKEVAAKDKIAMLQLDLTEQINNDWLEYSTLDSEVESLQFSYNASIDVIDSYIRQFRISKKSWLDVMNAQREKTQNFYQLTEAQMEKMKVTFRIMLNTGMLTASTLDVNNQ
jgi:adhesin transport system outer membrane protein